MKILEAFAVVVLLGVAVAVVKLFVRWEREGKEQLVPIVLLGLLVVEATLYADQNTLPRSIFHPGSGSTQIRLPEIYIMLALIARVIARGWPKRIGLAAGLWVAFAAWMVVGAVVGHLYHNGLSQDLYEAQDIIYIVGAYALAAGVPVRKYLDSGDLYRLAWLTVGCVSLVDLMTIAKISVNTNLPLLPLQNFGAVGSETAALSLGIVVIAFLPRLASGPLRFYNVLALVPVVAAVVLSTQRAVLVNLATVVGVLVLLLAFGRRGVRRGGRREAIGRRFHVRSGQVLLVVLAVVGLGLALIVVPAAVNDRPVQLPLQSTFQSLFHSEGKAESAQDRLNLAAEAEKLIPQHIVVGWGLGVEFPYYEAGFREIQTTAYAHDIALDLWLRLGLVGLVLYFVAFAGSIIGGLQVWRRHTDPRVAALALGLMAVLAGLTATAFLEPFLDEYRLAALFGVGIGILRSSVTSMSPPRRETMWSAEEGGTKVAPSMRVLEVTTWT